MLFIRPAASVSLLENFAYMELRKQVSWSLERPALFHFRTQSGQEVDLVLEWPNGQLVGIEVKAGRSVSGSAFKGLSALREAQPERFHRGVVLYSGEQPVAFGQDLHAVPFGALWQW